MNFEHGEDGMCTNEEWRLRQKIIFLYENLE